MQRKASVIGSLAKFVRERWHRYINMHAITPADAHSSFRLRLGSLPVGTLTVEGGRWTFRYSDEYRMRHDAKAELPVFPDLDEHMFQTTSFLSSECECQA